MASQIVTYICGHSNTVLVDTSWRIKSEAKKLCPKCFEAMLVKQRIKENAQAAEIATELELPKLIGSEKQLP